MATYTVSNTNSSGPGSLAAALASARDGDDIQFAVDGTIALAGSTALPAESGSNDQHAANVALVTTGPDGTAHNVTITGGGFTDAPGSVSGLGVGGLGTLTLAQTNTYSGETDLYGPGREQTSASLSILRAGSAGAFSPASLIYIDSGDNESVCTVDLGGFDETVGGLIANNVHFSPQLADVVTNSGGAPATLTIAAAGPSTAFATQPPDTSGYGTVFDGIIQDGDPRQGGSTLAVDVAGNLNLARASTYTGGTTIERGGILTLLSETAAAKIGGGMGFGSVQGSITDNGTLDVVAVAYGASLNPVTVANSISGSGGVTATVDAVEADIDGLVILTGHNTYTGATLIEHGTVRGGVADAFSPNSAVTVNGSTFGHGATLDIGGNAQAIGSLSGDSGGVVTNSGAAAVLTIGGADQSGTFLGTVRDGAGTVALVKARAGTEVLAGTDSYTGGTTIAAGTLEFASDAALPPGTIAFAGPAAILRLDAAPANGSTFADPLSGLAAGDALDLAALAFAAGAAATVSGNRLAVTSSGTTEYFTLAGAAATAFAVTRDAAGGTLVTGIAPPTAPVVAGTHGTADADEAMVTPFAGVTVADGNAGATDSVRIALTGGGGALTDPNGVLTRNPDGSYALAATDPATLSRELGALRFTPTNSTPGATAATAFALTVASSAGTTATDNGTAVTDTAAPAPAPAPAAAPVDSITVDQTIDYDGAGTFTLTGRVSSTVGVRGVEFTADIDGQPDQQRDLGAATVNPDGTFSFTDDVGGRLQGFITATETDDAGLQTRAAFRPALWGGTSPHADRYAVTPTDATYTGSTYYRADGSHRVTVTASDQTVGSAYKDAFLNDGVPDTTFVFDPGFGHDVVSLFRVDNTDHDTLSFKGSDFGTDPAGQLAGVLSHSRFEKGGVVITDPATKETVKILGITKKQLVQNEQDFTFHP